MPCILSTAILIGKETTYNVYATPTIGVEGQADSFKAAQEEIHSTGFSAGMHAKRADRVVTIDMGGDGSLEFDVLNKGLEVLLPGWLGEFTNAAAGGAWLNTATSNDCGSPCSYTIQVQRTDIAGTTHAFSHTGCVITGWTLKNDVGGLLTATNTFDFAEVTLAQPASVPVYTADAKPFGWHQGVVTVNGVQVDALSAEVNADLGMNTGRRFIRGTAAKKEPLRGAVPTFTGSISSEFESAALYELWRGGGTVPITMEWTGDEIAAPEHYRLKVTLPACRLTGSSPETSLTDVPKQDLPFEVLWDGVAPAVTIEVVSDTEVV